MAGILGTVQTDRRVARATRDPSSDSRNSQVPGDERIALVLQRVTVLVELCRAEPTQLSCSNFRTALKSAF
jgi:hypothetical protein